MIPPGYDDNRFFPVGEGSRNAIRQRLGFSGKVVMALGRLARNKGYDLLIQGFSVLASREPDAVLHLAIGGTSPTELEDSDSGRTQGVGRAIEPAGEGPVRHVHSRRGTGRLLPGRRPVRPLQPLRAVWHDGHRGDGFGHADGGHRSRGIVPGADLRAACALLPIRWTKRTSASRW